MRLPRVRFTVRRMMIAVAVLALLLAIAASLLRRSLAYQRAASLHRDAAMECAQSLGKIPTGNYDLRTELRHNNLMLRRMEWHFNVRAHYLSVVRRPWIAVEPDPPYPE
jgi:hypothetical protein